MAYSTSTPPRLVSQAIIGARTWYHESADATAAADADGFITNGVALGMQVGDIVIHRDITSTTTAITTHKVHAINADGLAVNLSDGTVTGSATSSD